MFKGVRLTTQGRVVLIGIVPILIYAVVCGVLKLIELINM